MTLGTVAKTVIGCVVGYLLLVAIFYPFVGGIAFFYALGALALGGLERFFVWIWTEGAKEAKPPEGPPIS
jgi:hypothetical protein